MIKPIILSLTFLLVAVTPLFADDFHISIHVQVDNGHEADTALFSKVESYFKRELRSLSDVVFTDTNDADYDLQVLCLRNTTTSGAFTGYTFSTVLFRKFPVNFLPKLLTPEVPRAAITNIQFLFTGVGTVVDHQLRVCSPDHLKETCETFVADFDTTYFEADRKLYRDMKDLIRHTSKASAANSTTNSP